MRPDSDTKRGVQTGVPIVFLYRPHSGEPTRDRDHVDRAADGRPDPHVRGGLGYAGPGRRPAARHPGAPMPGERSATMSDSVAADW